MLLVRKLILNFFNFSDGLHFTPYGNKVLYEEVVKKLRDGGLSIGTLPADLPLFSSIDPNDPLKSFSNWETQGSAQDWVMTSTVAQIVGTVLAVAKLVAMVGHEKFW